MNTTVRPSPTHATHFRQFGTRASGKSRQREEQGLTLKKVIGSTTGSVNGFDSNPSTKSFAYTAGATVVLATVGDGPNFEQRIFRANPSVAYTGFQDNTAASSIPAEVKQRALGSTGRQPFSSSPLGAQLRDWQDSPGVKTPTAKDRVKAATSVAISPNGKWLAVGQTGYRPAILIFAAADGLYDSPTTVIYEHSFGVHALSWSLNSKRLASLGTMNDGYLFVWNVDERNGSVTLHSTNKITSVVNDMAWMGRTIITAGLRFLKVWRPDEDMCSEPATPTKASQHVNRLRQDQRSSDNGTKTINPRIKLLAGKSTILNDMFETNFISILPISDTEALVCAETGEICLLDAQSKTQVLIAVATAGFLVHAAALDQKGNLLIFGPGMNRTKFAVDELKRSKPIQRLDRHTLTTSDKFNPRTGSPTIAAACLSDRIIELTAQGQISIRRNDTAFDLENISNVHDSICLEPVLGVHGVHPLCLHSASFLTYSSSGLVNFWDADGNNVHTLFLPLDPSPEAYDFENDMRTLLPCFNDTRLVYGERTGVLSVFDIESRTRVARTRAHSAEVTDVAICSMNGVDLIATAGRDRMIQLFLWQRSRLELLQTMDEHAGAVACVMFTRDGSSLMSCSADRTIVIRDALTKDQGDQTPAVFAISRTIALKSSPTSMCLGDQDDALIVAMMDRSIHSYNVKTGQAAFAFKCSDPDGGEPAIMSKVLFASSWNGNPVIAGVCGSDKSVRLYSEFGSLIARDYGHTEGVTSAAFVQRDRDQSEPSLSLVTTAADSTIYIWDSSVAHVSRSELGVNPARFALDAPIRKVLSLAELNRLRRGRNRDIEEPASPVTPQPSSPQRLRRARSRPILSQAPKLEPLYLSGTPPVSRRHATQQRSPSPLGLRNRVNTPKKTRRASSSVALRSRSSDDVLSSISFAASQSSKLHKETHTQARALTAASDAACKSLKDFRQTLANCPLSEHPAQNTIDRVETEIKLTLFAIESRSKGTIPEKAAMTQFLDRASEKISDLLEARIKTRTRTEEESSSNVSSPYISQARQTGTDKDPDVAAVRDALAGTTLNQ